MSRDTSANDSSDGVGRALVSGGTGFVGTALVRSLAEPVVFTRDPSRAESRVEEAVGRPVTCVKWDPAEGAPPAAAFEGVQTVFHLAGRSVDHRWTPRTKREMVSSRCDSTRQLVDRIAELDERPRTLVCASAIGIYGDRGDEVLDEASEPGPTGPDGLPFLTDLCHRWEEEAARVEELGVRRVSIRIGLVLGADGGALDRMLPIFRLGLGGRLGSGRQWMPWIHREDLVRLMVEVASGDQWSGPVNGVAPNPVTNRDFTSTLGSALGRWTPFPVPGFAMRLAMGEMGEVILASSRVIPARAAANDFEFQYPELEEALADIVS